MSTSPQFAGVGPLPVLTAGLPILYEDDEEGDLGESNPHVVSDEILHVCLKAHLAGRPQYQVFSNMNLYYQVDNAPSGRLPYVSPDTQVVTPFEPLPDEVSSYQVGREGPAPVLIAEVLCERSAQQRDLKEKLTLYAGLGVAEYVLVDVTGRFLPQRLLLKRLQPNRTWKDEKDADGGITSLLGFRLIIDTDGRLRILDAATGKRYPRPDEADAEAEGRRRAEQALRQAEEARRREEQARGQAEEARRREEEARRQAEVRIRELEAEISRLRGTPPEPPQP
jgi:Uma2 family endonuclease